MSAPKRLIDTAGMPEERWLECRKHGPDGSIPYTIGGSDTAVVLGTSPWRSPYELYMVKKGLMAEPAKSNTLQLKMGHLLEPVAAAVYGMVTGNQVIEDTWMYQHPDHPYALANLDYRVLLQDDNTPTTPYQKGAAGILECKSCSYTVASHWANKTWPIYYESQVRYYMGIMDLPFTDFAAVWGNNPDRDFAHPRVLRNMAAEDTLYEAMDEFIWRLENDKPPEDPADGCNNPKAALANLARIYVKSGGRPIDTIELPSKLAKYAANIDRLTAENTELLRKKKDNDKAIDLNLLRLATVMGEYEHACLESGDNKYLLDYVTSTRTSLDTDRIKQEHPEIYEEYKRTKETRKLVCKTTAA